MLLHWIDPLKKKTKTDIFQLEFNTYLFLLFVEVINDDTNKQIEGKEGSKNDEKDKVEVHVDVDFPYGLLSQLKESN